MVLCFISNFLTVFSLHKIYFLNWQYCNLPALLEPLTESVSNTLAFIKDIQMLVRFRKAGLLLFTENSRICFYFLDFWSPNCFLLLVIFRVAGRKIFCLVYRERYYIKILANLCKCTQFKTFWETVLVLKQC